MRLRPRYIPSEGWFERNEIFVLKMIVLLILVAIVLVATGYADKILAFINPDLESCKHGRCKGSCITESEVQKFGVQCVDSSKVCCIPKEKISSPECMDLNMGDPCGSRMLCDETLKCVSKCEYCSRFPTDESCRISEGTVGKPVSVLSPGFKCGCTENECLESLASGLGTCVKGFCPSTNPVAADYMCCDNP
jgi:hypothetical protein